MEISNYNSHDPAKDSPSIGDNPLLSILCITYNHENYVAEALDSFLMQSVTFPIEIVIGEDCSADKTLSVIERYQAQFPKKIRIIKSSFNVGITENFRRTLRACRGKYIAICEGDDYWTDKGKLQTQVDFLEKNLEYVITYHDAFALDGTTSKKHLQLPTGCRHDATKNELTESLPISTLTVCFRNLLKDIPNEFNHAPILDLCIWSLLGHHGKGKYLKEIKPAAYRMHDAGIFSSQTQNNRFRMTMHTYLCLALYYENNSDMELSQKFTLKTASIASIQLSLFNQLKLIGIIIDRIFGNRLYLVKKFLTGK